jgi:uncharacterized MAPEG superfamily protein
MTTPLWCLAVVTFFPMILSVVSGYYRNKEFGNVDNRNPRQQSAQLTGPGARAVAAQGNAWEALAMFTVAVMAVSLSGVATGSSAANASLLFVAVRVLHAVFYIADQDKLRSVSFLVGAGCCIYLLVLAA